MIKYVVLAAAAKAFSVNRYTKTLYRHLGNTAMSRLREREGLPARYVERAQYFLDLISRYDAVRTGNSLLELGTGWVHWEATCLRLFHDVDITLFDIWDTRLFDTFKLYFAELADMIDTLVEISPEERARVHSLLACISAMNSFDEFYQLLGLHYQIEPSGTLKHFEDESFDVIFSFDVLEHVKTDILAEYIQDFYRLLKPNGLSVHQIDIADHFGYYDNSVNKKHYMKYSDKTWNLLFENEVLYFNRVQPPDWMDMFRQAGLVLVEDTGLYCDTHLVRVAEKYENLVKQDRDRTCLRVVHRKPG